MKNYSSTTKVNSRRTSNRTLGPLFIVGGVVVVLFFMLSFLLRPLAELVVTPVVYLKHWVEDSEAVIPTFMRDRAALSNQIAELTQIITERSFDQSTIAELQAENKELEALLGAEGEMRMVANVLAKPGTVPFDTIVLDKGSSDGIVEKAPVYIGDSVVIGYVEKVFPETSVVLLVTSPNVETTVYVLVTNIYTTAVGQGGGVLRVGVPQGIELTIGNTVIIPSISSALFGEVVAVDSEPSRPEQYGFVTLEEALSTLYVVAVGEDPIEPVSFSEVQEIIAGARRDLLTVDVPPDMLIDVTSATSTVTSTATSTATSSPLVDEEV